MAWTVKDRRDAHFCHHGAKTMLQYLDAMTGMIDGVRRNEDIECLHRMRVASRRLRSLLPLVSDCLPTKQAGRWRRQLRRVTRALGDARDADVQAVCLQEELTDCRRRRPPARPGAAAPAFFGSGAAPCRRRWRRPWSGWRRVAAWGNWKWPCATSWPPASSTRMPNRPGTPIRAAAAPSCGGLQEVLAAAATIRGPQCGSELHTTRIAVKRLRYTMQAFAPLYPDADGLADAIRAARRLQDVLGNVHDCDVWVDLLPRFLEEEKARTVAYYGSGEPFEPLVAGVTALRDERQRQRQKYYREFADLWQKIRDKDVWGELCRALETARAAGKRQWSRAAPRPGGGSRRNRRCRRSWQDWNPGCGRRPTPGSGTWQRSLRGFRPAGSSPTGVSPNGPMPPSACASAPPTWPGCAPICRTSSATRRHGAASPPRQDRRSLLSPRDPGAENGSTTSYALRKAPSPTRCGGSLDVGRSPLSAASRMNAPPNSGEGRRVAFMDIGTNSIRLLIVRVNPNHSTNVLIQLKQTVRLGEGEFDDQVLQPGAVDARGIRHGTICVPDSLAWRRRRDRRGHRGDPGGEEPAGVRAAPAGSRPA